jgi:hypothetical protein
MKLDNDLTFRFDFSLRDDATANSKLDQNTAFGTAGQKVIRISPSLDYVLNSRVNVKLYFEQNRVIPKIATTAPVQIQGRGTDKNFIGPVMTDTESGPNAIKPFLIIKKSLHRLFFY